MRKQDADGANITTFGDALWWSTTTVTTVGYGDRFPVTTGGRLIAVALMVVGIAVVGAVTGSVAAWMVGQVQRDEQQTDGSGPASPTRPDASYVLRGRTECPWDRLRPRRNDGGDARRSWSVMSAVTYPVHVDAQLDTHVSRWLWLVKWLLALPHYILLAFLWVAFVVLSVVAFFAILFTGRYPRSIFDFNVGVLRWHWRVSYYAYGALGTDRYPPFSLHEVESYPAHLEIDYPEHLSRGLVLVKWWLLAIPHYLVVALLVGGTGYYFSSADHRSGSAGLIPLLVLVAGVLLLFTGRYPQPLFDLVLGLNRWVLRVAGYAGLMTDTYPPFRLDQGGHESGDPGTLAVKDRPEPPPAPPSGGAPPEPSKRSGWTAGRIVSLVVGCVLGLGALGLAVPAVALLAADQTARDDAGFLMSPAQTFETSTYAISSDDVRLYGDAPPALTPSALLGDTKLTATATDGSAIFVGIGPAADVRAYLTDVEHVTLVDLNNGEPTYRFTAGGQPATAPGEADFWAASSSGTGTQEVTWTPENGNWVVVVMNDDASRGVNVKLTAGAEIPAVPWVVGILFTLAAAGLLVGVLLVTLPLRAVSRGGPKTS